MIRGFVKSFLRVTQDKLKKDWVSIKNLVRSEIVSQNYEQAILCLEDACKLAYTYNFVEDYWDEEIEELIQRISRENQPDNFTHFVSVGNRIVFFDHFVLENRGFTQQYLASFMKLNVEILYVIDNELNYDSKNAIIQSVENYKNGKIAILKGSTRIVKLKELTSIVIDFRPAKVFIHTAPWEILSLCMAFNFIGSKEVKCYLLNITDHTFWPGITCIQNIIDYRSYGYNLNKLLKKKDENQLLLLSTPAYLKNSTPLQDFPDLPKDKVIGFSGGSYYKIMDRDNTFLHLIKDIINRNDNFIFLFACVGGEDEVLKFIKENQLEKQFILIGNRRDIDEVYKRIDIYINTYPYGGGLMLQYAIEYGKPLISLGHPGLYNTRLDYILDLYLSDEHIITDKDRFIQIATKLICNTKYRVEYTKYYDQVKKQIHEFEKRIEQLLRDEPIDSVPKLEFKAIQHEVTNFHIEGEYLRKQFYIPKLYKIVSHQPIAKRKLITIKYVLFRIIRKLKLI